MNASWFSRHPASAASSSSPRRSKWTMRTQAMSRILLVVVATAWARVALAQPQDPQARADELARIQEQVNDPNPLNRIAYVERLVAEGDTVKLQTAVRIMMTGNNDLVVRGLGFRAYLARTQRIVLEFAYEPGLKQRVDQAERLPEREKRRFYQSVRGLHAIAQTGLRGDATIRSFDFRTGRGRMGFGFDRGAQNPLEFEVTGDRLIASTTTSFRPAGSTCNVELWPTRDLMIDGVMTCPGAAFGRILIKARMY